MDSSPVATASMHGMVKQFSGKNLESMMMMGAGIATKAAHFPGKPPVSAQANDDKKNDGALAGETANAKPVKKDDMATGPVENTTDAGQGEGNAKALPTEVETLRANHLTTLELLKTDYDISSAVGAVYTNPLRLRAHSSKVSPVLLDSLLIDLNKKEIINAKKDTVMMDNTYPLCVVAIPSLMQGAAKGTAQFKVGVRAWKDAKKKADSLTDNDSDLTGMLLIGALAEFQKNVDRFYKMVLLTNNSPGMSVSTYEKIKNWIGSLEICVDNYWSEYRTTLVNVLLMEEIESRDDLAALKRTTNRASELMEMD